MTEVIAPLIQTVAILGAALAVVVRGRKNCNGSGGPSTVEAVRQANREKEFVDLIRAVLERQDKVLSALEKLCKELEGRPCAARK